MSNNRFAREGGKKGGCRQFFHSAKIANANNFNHKTQVWKTVLSYTTVEDVVRVASSSKQLGRDVPALLDHLLIDLRPDNLVGGTLCSTEPRTKGDL